MGGVTVSPGDFVIEDRDGVVVVPEAEGAAVRERATRQRELKVSREARVRSGESLASIIGLVPAE